MPLPPLLSSPCKPVYGCRLHTSNSSVRLDLLTACETVCLVILYFDACAGRSPVVRHPRYPSTFSFCQYSVCGPTWSYVSKLVANLTSLLFMAPRLQGSQLGLFTPLRLRGQQVSSNTPVAPRAHSLAAHFSEFVAALYEVRPRLRATAGCAASIPTKQHSGYGCSSHANRWKSAVSMSAENIGHTVFNA